MVRRDSGVVVAISGGPDSVTLLHVLNELKSQMNFRIVAAHLDHKLRSDSCRDAEFVGQLAKTLDIDLFLKEIDVRAFASKIGTSVEEAGRRVRYRFFEEVRDAADAEFVATGHQLDDALETFFLRLFRGSSLRGLRGIDPVRGHIIRPLIKMRRKEILRYLHEQSVSYRVDPTNVRPDTDRNFIRNQLFPLIRDHFRDFGTPLSRTLDMADQENGLLEDLASRLSSDAIVAEDGIVTINGAVLRTAPLPLAGRVLLDALYSLSGPHIRWSRVHVESIMEILRSRNPSARTFLPGGLVAQRQYDRLFIARQAAQEQKALPMLMVTGPGLVDFPGAGIRLDFRLINDRDDLPDDLEGKGAAYFDAGQIPFPLALRTFRPGDRFHPWGMRGTRKLKKIFIESRVPLALRRNWPLLVKDDEILWIPGIRRGRAAPILPHSSTILEARVVGGEEQFMQLVR
jgi:tRNA(Ile)-lysidine synthase